MHEMQGVLAECDREYRDGFRRVPTTELADMLRDRAAHLEKLRADMLAPPSAIRDEAIMYAQAADRLEQQQTAQIDWAKRERDNIRRVALNEAALLAEELARVDQDKAGQLHADGHEELAGEYVSHAARGYLIAAAIRKIADQTVSAHSRDEGEA
jgi:hypothetical protein